MSAMEAKGLFSEPDVATSSLARGVVSAVGGDGTVDVAQTGDVTGVPVRCDVLETGDGSVLRLAPRDVVLFWRPSPASDRGIVVGRVARPRAAELDRSDAAEYNQPSDCEIPEELVVEATKSLTLKCGEGSITFREDGRILIKGRDLVSHAQRMNRIKGGAVAIN